MKIIFAQIFALICILFLSNQIVTKTNNEENKTKEANENYSATDTNHDNSYNQKINKFISNNQTQINNDIELEQESKAPFNNKTDENVVEDINANSNSTIIFINSTFIDNSTNKHHGFEINFFSSFYRSFSLLLVSEVMDKTFIIILYFSTKLPPSKLLFFSGVSLIFMNCISIIIGYSIPFLLYRTLIEWIALISFIFLSFAYVNEAYHLEEESHEKKVTKTIKHERRTMLLQRRASLTATSSKYCF